MRLVEFKAIGYDLSPKNFAGVFDEAIGYKLDSSFNPYLSTVNYLQHTMLSLMWDWLDRIDAIDPDFANGGPPPIGAQKAELDRVSRQIIEEFGYQELGHLRAIIQSVGGIPRPLYDLRAQNFAGVFDEAIATNWILHLILISITVNYLLACYVIPYVDWLGRLGPFQI
ncbi:hypothetical protein GH714_023718 [Hevea brasiliensis]|uniref:Uncharacterized protein n=1 Tax=Hevea brasiliensis TaxID=3981 RepID=A0A6A6LD33_HEVBR|nr:hypothetical protein GH714_023718 [Hevea brasiliensis]